MARIPIRGLRARLSIAVALLVALAIALLAVVFNVVLSNRLSSDANGLLRSRVSGELAALNVVHGRLVLQEAPDDSALDTQVWVFAGRSEIEGPPSSPHKVRLAAHGLAAGPTRRVELSDPDLRLLAVPVTRQGRRYGTAVTAVSLKPYEDTERTALIASLILCGALVVFVFIAARWTVTRALKPVSSMTAEAARWSEADLDRRFDLGLPHDELTQLAATLDGLLERLSAALRHEQRFSAEISHELRTPLAKIRAEAEIALRRRRTPGAYRDALATVLSSAERMSAVVDTLLVAAREDGVQQASCDAARAAAAAAGMCTELSARRGVTVSVNGSHWPVNVAADEELVERILFPLIENGCHYAEHEVSVEIIEQGRRAHITVRDDGPGVAPDDLAKIFDPGARGSAATGETPGAGLGLALARRLARQVGGDVIAEPAPGGSFTADLPRSDG